jgi:hypothetical protein
MRVSNHLARGLPPSFETPREARAAPQDEVGIHSQTLGMRTALAATSLHQDHETVKIQTTSHHKSFQESHTNAI